MLLPHQFNGAGRIDMIENQSIYLTPAPSGSLESQRKQRGAMSLKTYAGGISRKIKPAFFFGSSLLAIRACALSPALRDCSERQKGDAGQISKLLMMFERDRALVVFAQEPLKEAGDAKHRQAWRSGSCETSLPFDAALREPQGPEQSRRTHGPE